MGFDIVVTQTGDYPHPGAQMLNLGTDSGELELELQYVNSTLAGGFGTRLDVGVLSKQGWQVWVNAIGEGRTTRTGDGRGEVLTGILRGYLEIEDIMSGCLAADHSFTLRAS